MSTTGAPPSAFSAVGLRSVTIDASGGSVVTAAGLRFVSTARGRQRAFSVVAFCASKLPRASTAACVRSALIVAARASVSMGVAARAAEIVKVLVSASTACEENAAHDATGRRFVGMGEPQRCASHVVVRRYAPTAV